MSPVNNFPFKNISLDVLEMDCSWTGPPSKMFQANEFFKITHLLILGGPRTLTTGKTLVAYFIFDKK